MILLLLASCGSKQCLYCSQDFRQVDSQENRIAVNEMLNWMGSMGFTPADTTFKVAFSPDEYCIEALNEVCEGENYYRPKDCKAIGQSRLFGCSDVLILSDTSAVQSLFFAFNGNFNLMGVRAYDAKDVLLRTYPPHCLGCP